ncbi:MAG: hypothetical protein M1829_003050 [Trizodia sp. TS-e1964]|nr:MAG: hypothetical protein M1829_003050 [Trizodia sp. TS-e1964]
MDPSRSRTSSTASSRPLVNTSTISCHGTLSSSSTQAERSLRQQRRSAQPPQPLADDPSSHGSIRQKSNQNTSLELMSTGSTRPSASPVSKPSFRLPADMPKAVDNSGAQRRDSADSSPTAITSSKDRPNQKCSKPADFQKDEIIKSLRSDLESLRNMVTCTICVRLLYEPYTLNCGHTFCYSVRQMIDIFISRTDLLQTGESIQEHKKLRHDEAAIIEADRANVDRKTGGLFRGCFPADSGAVRTIRDEEDGVNRCPACLWELEDSRCPSCHSTFGPDGHLLVGSSFGRFSDMDEDFYSSSEIDEENFGAGADLEMSFEEMDDFDSDMSTFRWQEYDSASDAIQREIRLGTIRSPVHRRAAHSAAGSRARRYAHSIVSDMQTSEDGSMARVEEEEEDDDQDEIGSLRNFIVNDDSDDSQQQPHRGSSRRQGPGRSRSRGNFAPAEPPSQSSESFAPAPGAEDVDDDDFDEGGAISSRRRQRPAPTQSRVQPRRRLGSRGPINLPTTMEEDEDPLLGQRGWEQLDQDNTDSINGFDDDDEDDASLHHPISISSDRSRFGGSLTPTAERPNPSARPSSRFQRRGPLRGASRGLRRLSSISTISTVTYEDGEADDDDSDSGSVILDRDGDVEMSVSPPSSPHSRTSPSRTRDTGSLGRDRAQVNRGITPLDAVDVDTDSTSDASLPRPHRRRAQRTRLEPEYDPRIEQMLTEYRNDVHNFDGFYHNHTTPDHWEALARSRASTPLAFGIARPPTANRHRRHPPISQFPFEATAQTSTRPFSPPSFQARNSSEVPAYVSQTGILQAPNIAHRLLTTPTSNNSGPSYQPSTTTSEQTRPAETLNADPSLGPNHSTQRGTGGISNNGFDRPKSRTAQISPHLGHPSRRGGSGREVTASPLQQPYPTGAWRAPSPRYNLPGHNNPFFSSWVRPKPSNRALREQSSTDTLRARTSRRDLRAQALQTNSREPTTHPILRPQSSRSTLRRPPSQNRLYSQASVQNLRSRSSTPASGVASAITSPRAPTSTRLTQEEIRHRAKELIERSKEAIAQRNNSGLGLTGRAASAETTVSRHQPSSNGNSINSSPHNHQNSSLSNSVDNPVPREVQPTLTSPSSRLGLHRQNSKRNLGYGSPAFIQHGFYGSSNSPYQNSGYLAQ